MGKFVFDSSHVYEYAFWDNPMATMSGCVQNTPTPSNPNDSETYNPTIDTDAIADQIIDELLQDTTSPDQT